MLKQHPVMSPAHAEMLPEIYEQSAQQESTDAVSEESGRKAIRLASGWTNRWGQ